MQPTLRTTYGADGNARTDLNVVFAPVLLCVNFTVMNRMQNISPNTCISDYLNTRCYRVVKRMVSLRTDTIPSGSSVASDVAIIW